MLIEPYGWSCSLTYLTHCFKYVKKLRQLEGVAKPSVAKPSVCSASQCLPLENTYETHIITDYHNA